MDEAPHITDLEKLITLDFQGLQMVKDVTKPCAFNKKIKVIDVKLDVFGPKEDLYYSTFPHLIKNVRRGNTIIKITSDDDELPQYAMGRKGLMKFFDMRLQFISKEERR